MVVDYKPCSKPDLAQGDDAEAARVVFFGRPGHLEASEPPGPPMYGGAAEVSGCGAGAGNGGLNGGGAGTPRLGGAPSQAQAPRELRERRRSPGSRQLAYASGPALPSCPASSSRRQVLQSLQQAHVMSTRCRVARRVPGAKPCLLGRHAAAWRPSLCTRGRVHAPSSHASDTLMPRMLRCQALTRWRAARRYVVVTRPIRHGRLKLALEEVLCAPLPAPAPGAGAPDQAPGAACAGGACSDGGPQGSPGRGSNESGSAAEARLEREVRGVAPAVVCLMDMRRTRCGAAACVP